MTQTAASQRQLLRVRFDEVQVGDFWLGGDSTEQGVIVDAVTGDRKPGLFSVQGRIVKTSGVTRKSSHWWSFPADMKVDALR